MGLHLPPYAGASGVAARRQIAGGVWRCYANFHSALALGRICMLTSGLARPRGVWPLDLFAIHIDRVYALLEERDESRDRLHERQRLWIKPGDVGIDLLAHAQRPVRRLALVGALALCLTRLQ